MIDVDERGRAAAAELNRAAATVADSDGAWQALLAGAASPAAVAWRRGRAWAVVAIGAAATIGIVALVAAERSDTRRVEVPGATTPATPAPTTPVSPPDPTTVPASTAPQTQPSTQAPITAPPPSLPAPSVLASVEAAAVLPTLVAASQMPFEITVAGQPVPVSAAALLALQAPDGRIVVATAGDAFGGDLLYDPATGTASPIPEAAEDGMRVSNPGDIATVGGAPTMITRRADPCNTEGAPCSRVELVLMTLDGSRPPQVVIGVGGTTIAGGGQIGASGGRFSVSDSGLVAGVAQLDGSANVAFLLDSTMGSDPDGPSSTALGMSIGLNGVATSDQARRIDAATVDQSGRAVAWLDAAGITVVDLADGDRRVFPLDGRPTNPLPVLDLALASGSIADGAVLLSAPGEPAYVLDLTDGSVVQVPDFVGTLTFSAMSPR